MTFKSKIARKIGVAAASLALVVGGVLVSAAPAQAVASITGDCFPAYSLNPPDCSNSYYSSTDNAGGQATGYIQWDNTIGGIELHGKLFDRHADGKAARLKVTYTINGVYRDDTVIVNPNGSGTVINFDGAYFATPGGRDITSADEITISACNGLTSSGNPANCDSPHGPFHNY